MAAYIDQVDTHLAPLTVLETLQFAFDCISGRGNESILSVVRNPETMKQIIEAIGSKVDIVTRFLGLEGCKNTVVGDDVRRGVRDVGRAYMLWEGASFCRCVGLTPVGCVSLCLACFAVQKLATQLTKSISGGQRRRVTVRQPSPDSHTHWPHT